MSVLKVCNYGLGHPNRMISTTAADKCLFTFVVGIAREESMITLLISSFAAINSCTSRYRLLGLSLLIIRIEHPMFLMMRFLLLLLLWWLLQMDLGVGML